MPPLLSQRYRDRPRRIPGLQTELTQPVERSDCPEGARRLFSEAKRHWLRPYPKHAAEQSVVTIAQQAGELIRLSAAIHRDRKARYDDRIGIGFPLDPVGSAAIRLDPERTGTAVEA